MRRSLLNVVATNRNSLLKSTFGASLMSHAFTSFSHASCDAYHTAVGLAFRRLRSAIEWKMSTEAFLAPRWTRGGEGGTSAVANARVST